MNVFAVKPCYRSHLERSDQNSEANYFTKIYFKNKQLPIKESKMEFNTAVIRGTQKRRGNFSQR